MAEGPNFAHNAIVANGDWRELTKEELGQLVGDPFEETSQRADWLTTWKLPGEISRHFDNMRTGIRKHNSPDVIKNLFGHPELRRGQKKLLQLCIDAGLPDGFKPLGTNYFRRPGLQSLARRVDGDRERYVGLHVDSWFPKATLERNGYPSRLCVNLGPESRYLNFVNLSLRQMYEYADLDAHEDPNEFVMEFMARFPSYPVLQLEIEPGEAYIAPTEFIIHDASSVGKLYFDCSITVLGDFYPHVVKNMFDLSTRTEEKSAIC